jgi:hypothetical protein
MSAPRDTGSSEEEDEWPKDAVILPPDEVMKSGLKLLGWDEKRLECRMTATNVEQYTGMYGCHLCVVAQLSEDLLTTHLSSAYIENFELDKLHWTLHFMYGYPTETERESMWQKCANTVRWACCY